MKKSILLPLLTIVFWGILIIGFFVPILSVVVNVLSGEHQNFVGWSYYLSGFVRSFLLAAISLILCWMIALPLITGFPFWTKTAQTIVFLFFAIQVQIGLIPRLYGYLGSFSSAGFIGVIGRWFFASNVFESPLAYNLVGTSLATNIIYGPFFFLPLISRMFRVSPELPFAVIDLGGRRSQILMMIIRNELRWSVARFSSIYFLLVFADFACSDLVGGGKVDAFGKTIYRTLIYFQDYWGASAVALALALVVIITLLAWPAKDLRDAQ